jgi:hypothetical protein
VWPGTAIRHSIGYNRRSLLKTKLRFERLVNVPSAPWVPGERNARRTFPETNGNPKTQVPNPHPGHPPRLVTPTSLVAVVFSLRPRCQEIPNQVFRPAHPSTKLPGSLVARLPGFRLALAFALAFEIERHCGADEILQGRLIDFVALANVDGAPDIPVEARVEQT